MAIIIRKKTDSPEALNIEINNGDLNALRTVKAKWKLKNEEAALRFALAVLYSAEENFIEIKNSDGQRKQVAPQDSLLAEEGRNGDRTAAESN